MNTQVIQIYIYDARSFVEPWPCDLRSRWNLAHADSTNKGEVSNCEHHKHLLLPSVGLAGKDCCSLGCSWCHRFLDHKPKFCQPGHHESVKGHADTIMPNHFEGSNQTQQIGAQPCIGHFDSLVACLHCRPKLSAASIRHHTHAKQPRINTVKRTQSQPLS